MITINVKGECMCPAGLMGALCDEYCQEGKWGHDCNNKCKCRSETSTCQAPTGQCLCYPGYFGSKCDKPCPPGSFGEGCKQSCGTCGEDQICDPVIGCCHENDGYCGKAYTEQQALSSNNNKSKIGFGIIGLIILVAILSGVVLYYRKKYQKEKCPDLPTVSFRKTEPTNNTTFGIEEPDRQFQNPLYARPLTQQEQELEKYKIGSKTDTSDNHDSSNEYETIRDLSSEAGPSSSTSSATNAVPVPLPRSIAPTLRGFDNPNADQSYSKENGNIYS
jgi:hypothetical protein